MFPTASAIAPNVTRPINGGGMVMLSLNVSSPSTVLSLNKGILTVVLVDPAMKVAGIGEVL